MDSDTVDAGALSTALIASTSAHHGSAYQGSAYHGPGTDLLAATDAGRNELGQAAAPAARNPAELLASLMDFPGSVALAELLQGEPSSLPGSEAPHARTRALPTGALGERLLLDAEARLDTLEPLVLKPLTGRRAPSIPSPSDLLFQLARFGLVTATDDPGRATLGEAHGPDGEARVRRFADDLGAPFRSALGLCLRQAQAHIATLRWEITHDLRALGPRADQLERLDAAISRSMQAKLGELLDRMEHAAHLTFIRACVHAVEALPEQVDDQTLAAWCDANGWLARYRERCVRMAKALFGHLRRNLEGLMRAASENDDWMGDP